MLSIIYLSSAPREKELTRKTEISDIFVHGKWESYPRPMSLSTDQTTNLRFA